ncbi:MAG TPA: membrane protein insertase YidC [Melioribacteraceae bacterium]|mgnify:CR=1 FL=1|nr:membrane protein insertase YidC [Melioribacteraceae bacterium]
MDKRTTSAFILIGIILVVWLYINSPTPPPQQPKQTDSTLVKKDTVKEKTVKEVEPLKTEATETAPFGEVETRAEKIITIETDLVKIEMTTKGARIRKYYLKNYGTWYKYDIEDSTNFYDRHVQLVNPSQGGDFNIIFVTKEGKLVNTAALDFNSNVNQHYYRLSGTDSLVANYEFKTPDNRYIRKNFVFYANDYASRVDVELENMNDIISSFRYDVVWSNGINFTEKNSVDEANFSNTSAFAGDEQVIVDAGTGGEKVTKDLNGKVDWVAVRNKYFAVIIAPDQPSNEGGAYFEGAGSQEKLGVRETYSASIKIPFKNESLQKDSFRLFIGPIDYDLLKTYGKNFEAVVDFGSFFGLTFVIRPISEYVLLPLLQFLHSFIPNYGLVIIIFSIIIKIALHPLTKQSLKSMKKMQLLQPKITELKEKFKDDPQKVQKETMKLYSTYGINPMGGCLPMLLQMPILIALWSLFNVAIDIRQQPFMLWINNLSAPDVIYRLPFKIPLFGIDVVSGLAILLGITMFLQQKMSIKDPSQKALVYLMPIMFTALFMTFPSGLNLYYFMFNLLSIAQQYYVNHKKGDGELVPVENPKQKKGFMARMMEAAEKQAQTQKKAAQKKR